MEFYQGGWKNNKRNGAGRLITKDGRCIVGTWRDDLLQGVATIHNADGGTISYYYIKGERTKRLSQTNPKFRKYLVNLEDCNLTVDC